MRIVFFGTPKYVLPILKALHREFKSKEGISPIAAVVTQEPKPSGRKQYLKYSAVDDWAHDKEIPIYFDPEKLVEDEIQADIGVLAAYGKIIDKKVINYFKHGILNIHPSLLPKYRGAAPVQAALVAGETETGVSVIKLDEKLDHGPVVSSFTEKIKNDDTTKTLRERLFNRSAEFVKELIKPYISGKVNLKKQDHEEASFTKLLRKDDAFINPGFVKYALEGKGLANEWEISFMGIKNKETDTYEPFILIPSPSSIERFIRAMRPWPTAWTEVTIPSRKDEKLRLKLIEAGLEEEKLVLKKVQLEGKTMVEWEQFKEGYPDASF